MRTVSLVLLLLLQTLFVCSALASWSSSSSSSPPQAVQVVQSARDTGDRWAAKPAIPFVPAHQFLLQEEAQMVLTVNVTDRYQPLEGFGGAITDSVAHIFDEMSAELQAEALDHIWGDSGLKYVHTRLTIGSCDFSVGSYSYDDTEGDYNMAHFSVAHDEEKIIPLIHRAMDTAAKYNRTITFLSTPWSPPAWMKRNHNMRNSDKPGLIQDPRIFYAWALYLSKYVTEYGKRGVPVSAITVENEPHVCEQFLVTYECCCFNATEEASFLADYLGPRLRADHPALKIYIFDDQKPQLPDYLSSVMKNPIARQYVDGVAFHWYGGNLKNYQYLEQAHKSFPQLPLYATEATLEAHWKQTDHWAQGSMYAVDIIGDMNAYSRIWVEWNVLLDSEGGPQHALGPCDSPLRYDRVTKKLEYGEQYWHMGHFSRFIPPGSVRLGLIPVQDPLGSFMALAAATPAGDVVVVVLNRGNDPVQFGLQLGNYVAPISIPAHAIQTLTIPSAARV